MGAQCAPVVVLEEREGREPGEPTKKKKMVPKPLLEADVPWGGAYEGPGRRASGYSGRRQFTLGQITQKSRVYI